MKGVSSSLDYTDTMRFEWGADKSESCFLQCGFDFAYAAHVFSDPDHVVREDTRRAYGEDRFQLTGRIEGRLYVVAYTPRPGTIRIISARKANRREVAIHENRSAGD